MCKNSTVYKPSLRNGTIGNGKRVRDRIKRVREQEHKLLRTHPFSSGVRYVYRFVHHSMSREKEQSVGITDVYWENLGEMLPVKKTISTPVRKERRGTPFPSFLDKYTCDERVEKRVVRQKEEQLSCGVTGVSGTTD